MHMNDVWKTSGRIKRIRSKAKVNSWKKNRIKLKTGGGTSIKGTHKSKI